MVLTDDERKERVRERARKHARKRRKENPEKVRESLRKYYYKHSDQRREKERVRGREHYKKNRKKVLEKQKKYRKANVEKVRERSRKWQNENPEKRREAKRRYRASKKGKETEREYNRKYGQSERGKEIKRRITRKFFLANRERLNEALRKRVKENPEHYRELRNESYRRMSQNPAWLKERNEYNRKHYHVNVEKQRARGKRYREKNPEKTRIRHKKYTESESGKEANRKWRANNRELISAYAKKSRKKNPRADTEIMKIYRRSHRDCEWSGCDRSSGTVHHILPQFKYPEYLDGDYHGRVGNNFICYCVFHHHAYHYGHATIRKEKRHNKLLSLLWKQVSDWAEENKIPIDALEIELELMFVQFSPK